MRHHALSLSLALAGVVTVGCGGDAAAPTAPARASRQVSLSFSTVANTPGVAGDVAPGVGATLLTPGVRGDLTIASATDTLIISRAQIVLSHVELMASQSGSCDDDSSPGCEALERGTLLVDLPTVVGATAAVTSGIPNGSYSALEARLAVPPAGDASASALVAAHPEFAASSVRVEGTFHGAPFVYTAPVSARLELAFSPPLVVDATTANLTIAVSLDGWFRTPSGSLIDPATANPGGANAATVAANIARSFHAFRDDGRDGHDDHGRDDGHGGGNGHDG